MKLFIVHSDLSEGSFAKLLSNSRYLTEEEFQKLKNYSSNDSRSMFADYVHHPEDATICEIDDFDALKKAFEQYSEESTWGGLIGFWAAPLDCDGYIILDIHWY